MMFGIYLNMKMCEDENISFNAVVIFDVLSQLYKLPYLKHQIIDGHVYKVAHSDFILAQIKKVPIAKRTLTKVFSELRAADLIRTNDNNMSPAFCFTEKSAKYVSDTVLSEDSVSNPKPKKNKPVFALKTSCTVDRLTDEYFSAIRNAALSVCQKEGVPSEEFEKFIEHHSAKGSKFTNWLAAFYKWRRNWKKWNANGGESKDDNGLYIS